MALVVREVNIGRRDDRLWEFHFLIANPAFLTMFGYTCEDRERLSFLDICIDETLDQCRGHLRELSEGVRLHYEI